MALTLQEIRDYVRESLDIEQDDLPDSLLDAYIREGSKRIERAEARWPFYEATYGVTLPSGETSVAKSTVGADLDQIVNIVHDNGSYPSLEWIGFDVYQELLKQQPDTTSRPMYYAEWGDTLHFFPEADTSYAVTVYGYRKAADWVSQGTGATPDLPDELHNTVAMWALQRAYSQQEDPELSALYERQFSDELNEFRRRLVLTPQKQPMVLNRGPLRSRDALLNRLRYDWEF